MTDFSTVQKSKFISFDELLREKNEMGLNKTTVKKFRFIIWIKLLVVKDKKKTFSKVEYWSKVNFIS